MKRPILSLAVILLACVSARAAMPEVLPYGTDLSVPPGQRVNKTDPKVVDVLGTQFSNPDPLHRAKILAEVGMCELPGGAPYARKGMADENPLVRAQAARTAATTGDKSLLADLKKLAGDKDEDVRVRAAAVQAAGLLGGDAVVAIGLADADPAVVDAAIASALPANADTIAKALPKYPPGTQLAAIRTLGRLAAAEQAGAVAPFLTSPSVAPRAAAATAIGLMKATAHTAAVDSLLADKHATVRRVALIAMADLVPTAEFQKRAITALADVDLSVREAAARLLAKYPTPDAIEALAGNLASESERLHLASRTALVAIGQPAVPKAEQLITDASPRRREDGSYVLGKLKSDASLEKHIALLSDVDWLVVRQAAQSLGQIGRKEAVPELVKLALQADAVDKINPPEARSTATRAIEQAIVACAYFNEKSIIPICRKVLGDKMHVTTDIRCGAAYALGRMDDPNGPVPKVINRIISDMEDSADVKFEGLKALGHMKSPVAKSWVGTNRNDAKYAGDAVSDWVAYWVRYRLTGNEVPYEPIADEWTAPVSVTLMGKE